MLNRNTVYFSSHGEHHVAPSKLARVVFRTADGGRHRREGTAWGRWGVEHAGEDQYVVYLVAGPRLTEFDNLACARRFCEAIDGLTDWSRPHSELVADKQLGLAVHQAALRVTGPRPDLPPAA